MGQNGNMQIIFHTGAHSTDDERLFKCLLRNKDALYSKGIAIPGPSVYRQILKEAFQALETSTPADNARDVLLEEILDEQTADRVFLSNSHFFGSQRHALIDGVLYPYAEARLRQMGQLFNFDQVEMFMAIRNPATFVPAILKNANNRRIKDVLSSCDPRDLRWSDMIGRLRDAAPNVPMTIWCNEDLPLIWGQVIREMAGIDPSAPIEGSFSLLEEIMTSEGMERFRAYVQQQPDLNEMQLRRIIAAFLDKFADEDAIEEELDLPGWTEDLVDEMTENYDEDVFQIQRIPGVNFITP